MSNPTKTLFMFEEVPESTFFEMEGDYSHLHDVYINGLGPNEGRTTEEHVKLMDELGDLVYDANGDTLVTKLDAPTKDWTHFVRCGFLL